MKSFKSIITEIEQMGKSGYKAGVKGRVVPYLVNPTSDELIKLFDSNKYKSIRALAFDGMLYVFNSEHNTHNTFADANSDVIGGNWVKGHLLSIDPYNHSHGTDIEEYKAFMLDKKFSIELKRHFKIFMKYVNKKVTSKNNSPEHSLWKNLALDEKKMTSLSNNTEYLHNPSGSEMFGFLNRATNNAVKVISNEKDFIMFEANRLTHHQAAYGLKLGAHYGMNNLGASDMVLLTFEPDGENSIESLVYAFKNSQLKKFKKDILKFMEMVHNKFKDNRFYDSQWGEFISSQLYNPGTTIKYTFKEHLIIEKSVRGIGNTRSYLVNPTGPELISFFKSSKGESIKYVSTESNLYVFDAYDYIHYTFISKELLRIGGCQELGEREGEPCIIGAIDPAGNSEGTYFDLLEDLITTTDRKWQYKPLLQLYQWMMTEYKKTFLLTKNEGYNHIWWWKNRFKKHL